MNMQDKVKKLINKFIITYKNSIHAREFWTEPLIAFADANDPLFLKLKQTIIMGHKLPIEVLDNAATVISYFIPFTNEVVSSNNNKGSASKDWAISYIETNKLINKLNEFLANKLIEDSFDAVIIPPTHNFDKNLLVSHWSHKHVAYIAGLGKFGLHKMIITEKGCCGRLGSLVTSAKIEITKRLEKEYCLYFHNKSCMKCLEKCVFDSLKINTFDRHKCYKVCLKNSQLYTNLGLADVCGKCACGVPCSLKNPVK
ncbi:MAG: epoxyqueuosine reductase [Promethearchaeota archaeon]